MEFTEVATELKLNEEQIGKLTEFMQKNVQSHEDKVRTEYSSKLKDAQAEVEKYKPKEKSDAEIELEQLKAELNKTKFEKSLKDIGVDDSLAKYLRNDIDTTEFAEVYKGFKANQSQSDYVAKKHPQDVGVTKEQFKSMGYAEKAKLYETNPSLYAELTK